MQHRPKLPTQRVPGRDDISVHLPLLINLRKVNVEKPCREHGVAIRELQISYDLILQLRIPSIFVALESRMYKLDNC